MKNLILASTSTLHGQSYLHYLLPQLENLFINCNTIIFIPYARPSGISHDAYTEIARKGFSKIGKNVVGLHTFSNPEEALKKAEGIFTGGGNTFVLVNELYKNNCMSVLKTCLLNGTPYLGTSAGSNIAGISMQTTNDMPIAYPPSFKTLGVVPFNINAHYLDPDTNSTHKGETRETRIKEFHTYHDTAVVGLREGNSIRVQHETYTLLGEGTARLFTPNEPAIESKSLPF